MERCTAGGSSDGWSDGAAAAEITGGLARIQNRTAAVRALSAISGLIPAACRVVGDHRTACYGKFIINLSMYGKVGRLLWSLLRVE